MKQLNKDSKAQDYKNAITSFYNVVPTGYTTNWVLGNHDGSRIATRFGTNFTDILNCLLQTLPGASVTYLGDEIGMTDVCVTFNTQNVSIPCSDPANIPFTREFVRAPFQWDNSTSAGFSTATKTWLPVASNYKEVNLKLQESQEGSHINIYKKLLKLRSHDAIKSREFSIEVLSDNVLVYKRFIAIILPCLMID